MPPIVPAVIVFDFDPILTIGDVGVRLETIGVALATFAALALAALIARNTPLDATRPPDAPGPEPGERNHLRNDDLLYIAVAALPGAVIGGRLGYALVHLEFYRANPTLLVAIGQGGFQLSLAVVGGVVTGGIVAALLGAPVGRWLHVVALPVLFGIALGKGAMVLGGSGQGVPTDVSWATAYLGPGPWGSLAPAIPSHPAQVYEAIVTAVVILIVAGLLELGAFPGRNGGAFFLAIGLWCSARAAVAMTWRDPAVLGPLSMDQVISFGITVSCIVILVAMGGVATARGRRRGGAADPALVEATSGAGADDRGPASLDTGPEWPDPGRRPRL